MQEENRLLSSALNVFRSCLPTAPGEKVILISDPSTESIAAALVQASVQLSIRLEHIRIKPTGGHGREPDPAVAEAMKKSDAVLIPAKYSMTHTKATRDAKAAGARVVTLPGIDEFVFSEGLKADPIGLRDAGLGWIKQLSGKRKMRVVSDAGTDLSFTTGETDFLNDDGCFFERGAGGNLPAGEVFVAPDESSANGMLVVDGSIGSQEWTLGASHAKFAVRNGSISGFSGERALMLESTLSKLGPKAFVLAEFGIGTNPCLRITGNLLGDEKVRGTVHFAFGNNMGFGGKNDVQIHIDCIVRDPTLYVDGEILMDKGRWLAVI